MCHPSPSVILENFVEIYSESVRRENQFVSSSPLFKSRKRSWIRFVTLSLSKAVQDDSGKGIPGCGPEW